MTAIDPGALTLPTSEARQHRVWRIVRLNLVNKWTVIWLPIVIMGFIWLVNWLIWWIIWAADLVALPLLYLVFGRGPLKPADGHDLLLNLKPVAPTRLASIVDDLFLPLATGMPR